MFQQVGIDPSEVPVILAEVVNVPDSFSDVGGYDVVEVGWRVQVGRMAFWIKRYDRFLERRPSYIRSVDTCPKVASIVIEVVNGFSDPL